MLRFALLHSRVAANPNAFTPNKQRQCINSTDIPVFSLSANAIIAHPVFCLLDQAFPQQTVPVITNLPERCNATARILIKVENNTRVTEPLQLTSITTSISRHHPPFERTTAKMPSSSKRNTPLERHLYTLFQTSFSCLEAAGLSSESKQALLAFANLLDIHAMDLHNTLNPDVARTPYTAGQEVSEKTSSGRQIVTADALMKAREDTGNWIQFRTDAWKLKKDSERVWTAGDEFGKVGRALYVAGRDEEARQWCEWGEQLHERASAIIEHEEAAARRVQNRRGDAQRNHISQALDSDDDDCDMLDGTLDRRAGGVDLSGFS